MTDVSKEVDLLEDLAQLLEAGEHVGPAMADSTLSTADVDSASQIASSLKNDPIAALRAVHMHLPNVLDAFDGVLLLVDEAGKVLVSAKGDNDKQPAIFPSFGQSMFTCLLTSVDKAKFNSVLQSEPPAAAQNTVKTFTVRLHGDQSRANEPVPGELRYVGQSRIMRLRGERCTAQLRSQLRQ